jgi:DNA-binding transcriptional LysR family regulator
MRQDVHASKTALAGHLTLAAVPTALPMAVELTTPFRAKHPRVRLTILSSTSRDILSMLDDFRIDAGLTYLDNEPLSQLHMVPLYRERYILLTSAGNPLADRAEVAWADVGRIPLCLLTPDMQNRRIIDRLLTNSAVPPPIESNAMVVLFSHARSGGGACIMPEKLANLLGVREPLRSIPITEPRELHIIGLVSPHRDTAINPGARRGSRQARHAAKTMNCRAILTNSDGSQGYNRPKNAVAKFGDVEDQCDGGACA